MTDLLVFPFASLRLCAFALNPSWLSLCDFALNSSWSFLQAKLSRKEAQELATISSLVFREGRFEDLGVECTVLKATFWKHR